MHATTKILAGLLAGAFTTGTVMAESFAAEKNYYVVTQGSSFLGHAATDMQPTAAGENCFLAKRVATPKRSLRWLTGEAVEETTFCITADGVVPKAYRYARSGVGSSDENFTLDFDFAAGVAKATGKKGRDRAIAPGLMDKYSVEYGLRLWAREQRRTQALTVGQTVDLQYADKKSNKTYSFIVSEEEEIDTPFGLVKARRFEAVTKKGRTTFWLDAVNDFRLVQFEREKKGKTYKMVAAPKGYKPR